MTTEYTVTWTIEVEADSPLDAAEQVRQMMLDPGSTAQSFEVRDPEGNGWDVDLWPEPLVTERL